MSDRTGAILYAVIRHLLPASLVLLPAFASAQLDFQVNCPAPDTVACLAVLPAPTPDSLTASTTCTQDLGGNAIGGANCDATTNGCYSATASREVIPDNGGTVVTVSVTYNEGGDCRHDISYVAIALPAGMSPWGISDGGSFDGTLGTYDVEYTEENPFHGVKFETRDTGTGFGPGSTETFTFNLLGNGHYADDVLAIQVKASTERIDLELNLACDDGPTQEDADMYAVTWDYDYVVPGGTGCADDPIVIERHYSASDGCLNTAFCTQRIVVAGACDGTDDEACGTNVGGDAPGEEVASAMVYDVEARSYAVTFAPSPNESAAGVYLVYRVGARGEKGAARSDGDLLGIVAPGGGDSGYSFTHAGIGDGDDVAIIWRPEGAQVWRPEGRPNVSGLRDGRAAIETLGIFPNPGTSGFRTSATDFDEVQVHDQLGRLINTALTGAPVDMSAEPAGVYLVTAKRDGRVVARQRWIKR